MSAVSDIVLNDGQATPVAHTFEPSRVASDMVIYHDKSSGVVAGYNALKLGNRLASRQNENYKATGKLVLPTLESAATNAAGFTPGPTVAYELRGDVSVVIPSRATDAERSDLEAYLKNLVANAVWGSLVTDAALPY